MNVINSGKHVIRLDESKKSEKKWSCCLLYSMREVTFNGTHYESSFTLHSLCIKMRIQKIPLHVIKQLLLMWSGIKNRAVYNCWGKVQRGDWITEQRLAIKLRIETIGTHGNSNKWRDWQLRLHHSSSHPRIQRNKSNWTSRTNCFFVSLLKDSF